MTRIHVTGGPGSGKTMLARRLAARLAGTAVDLDVAAYAPGVTAAELDDRRAALIAHVGTLDVAVTEGSFVDWAEPFFEQADTIVFLEVPLRAALRRVASRHLRASLRRENPYKGLRRLARFLRMTYWWYTSSKTRDEAYGVAPGTTGISNLRDTRECAQRYGARFCRTPQEIERMLRALPDDPSTSTGTR